MKLDRSGASRDVLLIGDYAVKFPKFFSWKAALLGLLANMREQEFSREGWPELCPVLWGIPGGFMIVMARAEPMTFEEWSAFDDWAFRNHPDYVVPCESKPESYGWLGGRVVAIDYGN